MCRGCQVRILPIRGAWVNEWTLNEKQSSLGCALVSDELNNASLRCRKVSTQENSNDTSENNKWYMY